MDNENLKSTEHKKFQDDIPLDTLKNLPSTDKINENIIKYKTPVGRSGPIVGIFPIVLSDFQIDINCEIKYKYPILSIRTLSNNVNVSKFRFLNDNYKLLIEGHISKNAEIISENNRPKKTVITIPFRTIVDVKYNTYPMTSLPEDCNIKNGFKSISVYKSSDLLRIAWKLESINLFEKITPDENSNEMLYKIIVSLDIILLQNQKVFIPEPIGDFSHDIDEGE